jgi:hypothetical protein
LDLYTRLIIYVTIAKPDINITADRMAYKTCKVWLEYSSLFEEDSMTEFEDTDGEEAMIKEGDRGISDEGAFVEGDEVAGLEFPF